MEMVTEYNPAFKQFVTTNKKVQLVTIQLAKALGAATVDMKEIKLWLCRTINFNIDFLNQFVVKVLSLIIKKVNVSTMKWKLVIKYHNKSLD